MDSSNSSPENENEDALLSLIKLVFYPSQPSGHGDASSPDGESSETILSIINHVFLPPQLPDHGDNSQIISHGSALIRLVISSLREFRSHVSSARLLAVDDAEKAMVHFQSIRDETGSIDEQRLAELLNSHNEGSCLGKLFGKTNHDFKPDKILPLHITAQNAGIIITQDQNSVVLEAFELSPTNKAVMSTTGRLRRNFPASSISIPVEKFREDGFINALAGTLRTMSHQQVTEAKSKILKKGQSQIEERDTTNPFLVTDFLQTVLLAHSKETKPVSSICKNTREEVIWKDALMPWQRSPIWLMLRVTLQLIFERFHSDRLLYKEYMIFLMTHALNMASKRSFRSDLLYCMMKKIGRRLKKLGNDIEMSWVNNLRCTIEQTMDCLQKRWNLISREPETEVDVVEWSKKLLPADGTEPYPELDEFIGRIDGRMSENSENQFKAPWVLQKFDELGIPDLNDLTHKSVPFHLSAMEEWTESSLPLWMHNANENTCIQLYDLAETYYDLSQQCYSGCPESLSIASLTILELWMTCDKFVCDRISLVREYSPQIPVDLLQSLVLHSKSHLERLVRVEEYISRRCNGTLSDIFTSFGCKTSFSVRYYETSAIHQKLRRDIEQRATEERELKRKEFHDKRQLHDRLKSQSDSLTCDYHTLVDRHTGIQRQKHSGSCKKHSLLRQAEELSIEVHEWPLPDRIFQAQSAVFELNVPSSFSAWRDMTTLVINYVLECDYIASQNNKIVNRLSTYLSSQFSGAVHRLELGSTTKSNKQTHRRKKNISTCSNEKDVLVKNGLRYEYYDNHRESFVSDFQNENNYSRSLMFKLSGPNNTLQDFIFRPPGQENGLTPNHVLSRQYYYSQNLSLEESKALATLPVGHCIAWENILVQLFTPKIDFNKSDTVLIIMQIINQAGPPRDLSMHRASHQQLCDEPFVKRLLEGLSHAIDRIYKNWESYISLRAFIAIAIKALNCASIPTLQQEYRQLLGRCRSVATNWINLLQKKLSEIRDEEQRQDFYPVISQISLICIASFDVDEEHLRAMLSDAEQMRMLIHSSVIMQNLSHGVGACTEPFHVNLMLQKNRVLYNSRQFIITETLDKMNQGLNLAVKAILRFYNEEGLWKLLSDSENHWLETKTTPRNGKNSLSIQFNTLTGELLVNGLPPSRLPAIYEEHPVFRELFGRELIEVMPSDIPGTLFSSMKAHHGYTFAFGMNQSTPPQLILVASANNITLDLIPRESLNHNLPTSFINDYVHWYNRESGIVEFRPANSRWCSSTSNWHLENPGSAWTLRRPGQILLCPTSPEIRRICHNLRSLEQETHIHNILDNATFALNISLPRLRLEFSLEPGSSEMHCRQFRGMYVDKIQRIGTLVGLNSKLALRDGQNKRMLLVPDGHACYLRNAGHVRVEITYGSSNRVHPFTIDTRLGRLVDNGSLQSKLCIAYLHALTSYCLPDKLTGNTGTEQCLTILNSAAVRSFPQLLKEDVDILDRISKLSPGREYYPKEERVMETIYWDKEISFLSQPGSLHTTVLSIIEEANRNLFFHSEQSDKYAIPNHVDTTLGLRHQIRDSTFYLSGFGAENHSNSKDARYESRDVAGKYTERSRRAFEAATMVTETRQTIHRPISPTFALDMWKLLNNKSSSTQGPKVPLPVEEIGYDGKWLSEASSIFAAYWCRFHHNFGNKQQQPLCRFQLMFCAATLAYAENHDAGAVQAIIACANIPSIGSIEVPDVDIFDMPAGYEFVNSAVYNSTLEYDVTSFMHSQEATISRYSSYESDGELEQRRYRIFENNRRDAVRDFTSKLQEQWICPIPVTPEDARFSRYIHTANARARILPTWKKWYENHLLFRYLTTLGDALRLLKVMEISTLYYAKPLPPNLLSSNRGLVNQEDLFSHCAPSIDVPSVDLVSLVDTEMAETKSHDQLDNLINLLRQHASRDSEHKYIQNLEDSQKCHSLAVASYEVTENGESLSHILKEYLSKCETTNNRIYHLMAEATGAAYDENTVTLRAHTTSAASIARYYMAPRVSPMFFLGQLARRNWEQLSLEWKKAIVAYAQSLTMVQRAERMLSQQNNNAEFLRELLNTGHTNWNPLDYPESLLLEVESGIMIREVQENIASQMRNPPQGKNATMQLNMGEGKSTVILPTVAAYLADSSRLVVVICTKPQAKEMFRMLTSKLGGLMNHQVYQMPFSRTLRFTVSDAQDIFQTLRRCSETGGILLMQPEHLLSFKLMGIENQFGSEGEVGQILLEIQHYFNNHSRTIVDESDDIFSVKFELIYTMGEQVPVELSPSRWIIIQRVFSIVMRAVYSVREQLPQSIEISHHGKGRFPRIRILRQDAEDALLSLLAEEICAAGLPGLPIMRQPQAIRECIREYILNEKLEISQINSAEVESGFFTESMKGPLLLVRGLIAQGVLSFAFRQKRWRVNYGLDQGRVPKTRLAVPYRAKDSPTTKSEFSHPDVVIELTQLTYYYGGLSDDDLFAVFDHLLCADQAEAQYQDWVLDAPNLPKAFKSLSGVTMKDRHQATREIFPHFRYAKNTIDYFLSHLVFAKEMKEFPKKLSASGWDIGQLKAQPTTGFSGTCDSRNLMPLDMEHLDLMEQRHTNATVLQHILQPKNSIALLPRVDEASDAEVLLNAVIQMEPPVQVILDVGAQILELTNIQLATAWLKKTPEHQGKKAAIYFDDDDELCVLDQQGRVESFQTSPYSQQLDLCLVFLDESHTRGTDLKLPAYYRAAVTLGPGLTKDRLVQACMRLRKLGKGQSVVFCISEEIQAKIFQLSKGHDGRSIQVADVLAWAIHETFVDLHRSIPMWAIQGQRFEKQRAIWESVTTSENIQLSLEKAQWFLEAEIQSLDDRYRPHSSGEQQVQPFNPEQNPRLDAIWKRCEEFGNTQLHSSALWEEQERELSPEIVQERQIERPPPVEPEHHAIHPKLTELVNCGSFSLSAPFYPAFEAFGRTRAAQLLDIGSFPDDVIVTQDFMSTVILKRRDDNDDFYQRSVQWILSQVHPNSSMVERLVIISPHEAQELKPLIATSRHVHLHLYSPLASLAHTSLESLKLYTVPALPKSWHLPSRLRILLNLFSGQLYINSEADYHEVCKLLNLSYSTTKDGATVEPDGFIVSQSGDTLTKFKKSPVVFLKAFMTIRWNSELNDKTYWGTILAGDILEFQNSTYGIIGD